MIAACQVPAADQVNSSESGCIRILVPGSEVLRRAGHKKPSYFMLGGQEGEESRYVKIGGENI